MVWPSFQLALADGIVHRLVFDSLDLPNTLMTRTVFGVAVAMFVFVPSILLIAVLGIWWERKVAGRIQSRPGPNRVGPIGILQSFADGIKLITKEDLRPAGADAVLFKIAPYLAFIPVFAVFLALPFGPDMTFEPRLSAGVFWILAMMAIEVIGVILAGWSSNNKWSLYGAMREACQIVSYEVPLGLSIIVGVMAAGTLNMVQLGHLQGGGIHTWLVFQNPFAMGAFVVYFIASLASNKRAPFDLPESDSELVAGYHTEYSGMRFAFFFFAEYAAMFVVAGIQVGLFLGGWHDPLGLIGYFDAAWRPAWQANPTLASAWPLLLLNVVGVGIFVGKCILLVFVQMWLRWTLPRPRIDQVLYTCIKVLLPLTCVLLLGTALWQLLIAPMPGVPWRDFNPYLPRDWSVAGSLGAFVAQMILANLGGAVIGTIVFWIVHARGLDPGRRHKKRLTDPAPIPVP
ncbi:MAG TPA: NADH-quinone oxidoreductase subunit NuoH [Tepidisphaeraceae bacterium]|jgi:NADH-quinone oxidoreductase subunit H|nr:NADH-quinone oxidoreductase subunit NuoH [Tepidisphaeraceae bacterium]